MVLRKHCRASSRYFVSEIARFQVLISLWLLWKGQSTILALVRRRILEQYPAPCSPGPFVLLLTFRTDQVIILNSTALLSSQVCRLTVYLGSSLAAYGVNFRFRWFGSLSMSAILAYPLILRGEDSTPKLSGGRRKCCKTRGLDFY